MHEVQLFQLALGLNAPWYVTRSEFDAAQSRLDLYIDFAEGAAFPALNAVPRVARPTTPKRRRGAI